MATRADRIYEIIKNSGGRMSVANLRIELAKEENTDPEDLMNKIAPTVAQDNKIRSRSGVAERFKTFGNQMEEFGYISIYDTSHPVRSLRDPYEQIPELIQAANKKVKEQLEEAIQNLSWQKFESNFMTQVLEALGFSSVEVTQATRDGGVDARCFYNRGIIRGEACVSAKGWKPKNKVGRPEVQRMLGIGGRHDTVIIFTSSKFTPDAKKEAEPQWNPQRTVVLIDGDLIVDTCFREKIGVEEAPLPVFSKFVGFESEQEEESLEG